MRLVTARIVTQQAREASEVIKRIELQDGYSVIVENDSEKQKTQLGVEGWVLLFNSKQDVVDHIKLLNKALEFWEFD